MKAPRKRFSGCLLVLVAFLVVGTLIDAFFAEDKPTPQVVIPANEPQVEMTEEACRKDFDCWNEKHRPDAFTVCAYAVENQAPYDFEWTDGFLGVRFPNAIWYDKDEGTILYLGKHIKFQNGFGAWQHMEYACVYDTINQRVSEITVGP